MKDKYLFTFKKFVVHHKVNAQKVGTDSMLLGAWTSYINANSILDVGTGCGLLSLMAAQLTNEETKITAVEIVPEFANEAKLNFENSPWKEKISLINVDVANLHNEKFDLIICNPPYFENQLKSPSENKNLVRHNIHLNLNELPKILNKHLHKNGKASIVLPTSVFDLELQENFEMNNLFVNRKCEVKHNSKSEVALLLLEFSKIVNEKLIDELLTVKQNENEFTEEYISLMKDFLIIIP